MADILNQPDCGGVTSTLNTGIPLCDVLLKQPKALLLVDAGFVIPAASRGNKAAVVALLKAATRAVRGNRVYPILDLTNYEDVTKEPSRGTVGNLSITEIILNDAIPAFKYQTRKGVLFHQQLVAAQNASVKMMIIDSAYVLYGTKVSNGDMTGYSLSEFYAELMRFATASEPSKYPFSVVLASLIEYKENFAFTQLDSTVLSISGNRDVVLSKISQAANVINVALTARGGTNLGSLYPVELAAVGAWDIINDQTAAPVTVTSVTYNSAGGYYVVTADSTAYAALATGQTMSVNLKPTAALSALGVDGYESTGSVKIVKP